MASLVAELAEKLNAAGNSFTIDESTIVVDTLNNRVGIGASPTANVLEVSGTASAQVLKIDNITIDGNTISSTDENGNINITPNGTGSVVISNLTATTSATLQHASNTKLSTTSTGIDVTGTVTADGLTVDNAVVRLNQSSASNNLIRFTENSVINNHIGTDGSGNVKITGWSFTNDTIANFASNGDISFYEDTGTTAKFFWDASAESLGIGTTSPTQTLQVDGGAVRITGNYSSISNNNGLLLGYSGDNANYYAVGANGGGVGQHVFYGYNYTTGSGAERMRIDSSGNVGIGTSSPSAKLDVNGDAKINGITVGLGSGSISTNTAVGVDVLASNTTGYSNIAIGYESLYSNTTGYHNVAAGRNALYSNIGGIYNVAVGYRALYSAANTSYNVAVGMDALYANISGSENTAIGRVALSSNTDGSSNVAVGRGALYSSTSSQSNVAVGYNAGYYITTGSKNTIIGSYDGNQDNLDIRTSSNNVVLSDGDGNRHLTTNMITPEVRLGGQTTGYPGHLAGIVPLEVSGSTIGTSTVDLMSSFFDLGSSVGSYLDGGIYYSPDTQIRFVLGGIFKRTNNNAQNYTVDLVISHDSNAGNQMTPSSVTVDFNGVIYFASACRGFMSPPFSLATGGNQNNHRFQGYLTNLSVAGMTGVVSALNLYVYYS